MALYLANHFTGLGTRYETERTEKRMVAREQGESIMDTGTAVTQEWDAAWESDGESKEEESESRNRMSLDEERQANEMFSKSISSLANYDSSCPFLLPNQCDLMIHLMSQDGFQCACSNSISLPNLVSKTLSNIFQHRPRTRSMMPQMLGAGMMMTMLSRNLSLNPLHKLWPRPKLHNNWHPNCER